MLTRCSPGKITGPVAHVCWANASETALTQNTQSLCNSVSNKWHFVTECTNVSENSLSGKPTQSHSVKQQL